MDKKKIEQGIRLLLEGIGENPERIGLEKTPRRVAEMCEEIFAGVNKKVQLKSGFSEPLGEEDCIEIREIRFYSICEHHLLPFFGEVNLLYLPGEGGVAGFSDIVRVVNDFSRRPQLQERLTAQIADTVMTQLSARGIGVVVKATQLCVAMRGEQQQAVETVTTAIRGAITTERISNLK